MQTNQEELTVNVFKIVQSYEVIILFYVLKIILNQSERE